MNERRATERQPYLEYDETRCRRQWRLQSPLPGFRAPGKVRDKVRGKVRDRLMGLGTRFGS
jgi:hypothetical protein